MMTPDYTFIPAEGNLPDFRCGVPLQGTKRLMLVDGGVQGSSLPLSISLHEGERMEHLLQVIAVRKKEGLLSFHSNFSFEKGSTGRILLCSHTEAHRQYVTDETVNLRIGQDAAVEMVVMQHEFDEASHLSRFIIDMDEASRLSVVFVTLHGGHITNEITVNLRGRGAECRLAGLYLTDGEQKVDTKICLNHLSSDCRSDQLFKGILDGKSSARFDGLIKVGYGACRSEAYQANHNLLLSKTARVFSEPQLEIYNDDVKCSHGATNGRLDENELFYLRSRGISLGEARILQQMAFAYSVLEHISDDDLRERIALLTEKRLRGENL